MGTPNLVDGQFGPQAILRPFAGFEVVYDASPGTTPIMFNEQIAGTAADALDPQAGRTGYSPYLMRGLAVPEGARVQILLPGLLAQVNPLYTWQIVWRMRNPGDAAAREGQINWHFPKQVYGVADTRGGATEPRVIIPSIYETVLYSEAEPVGANDRVTGHLRIDTVSPRSDNRPRPFLPAGTRGEYEQGIVDPGGTQPWVAAAFGFPSYNSYFSNAKGDEMLLALYRDAAPWDFFGGGADDAVISDLFGVNSPNDLGVYVSFGSAP